MRGILYGAGVGPGDPELMTLKAVRIIKENNNIAVPGKDSSASAAYNTALQAVPEIAGKNLIPINVPMVKDRQVIKEEIEKGARTIEEYLEKGENVVYITLGDPAVYSTFSYLQEIVLSHGFDTYCISGVPSFCLAAAKFKIPLAQWDEPLSIIPAAHKMDFAFDAESDYVFMKAGRAMNQIRQMLSESGHKVYTAENCGMEGEKLYYGADEMPGEAGYFSIVIARKRLK
ncbi:MAG: precorrin-2 C(20)-methyltransferase [Firmicutes bacterium]|nr:precorrin-2 C(20)-methyltransferase [Bacillota bacterium]